MTNAQIEVLIAILADTAPPMCCKVCGAIWVNSGNLCTDDCTGTHRDVSYVDTRGLVLALVALAAKSEPAETSQADEAEARHEYGQSPRRPRRRLAHF